MNYREIKKEKVAWEIVNRKRKRNRRITKGNERIEKVFFMKLLGGV